MQGCVVYIAFGQKTVGSVFQQHNLQGFLAFKFCSLQLDLKGAQNTVVYTVLAVLN
jgi:hypothetical protein